MEDAPIQLTIAGAVIWALKIFRNNCTDPLMLKYMPQIQRYLSLLAAMLTSLGIGWAVEGSLWDGSKVTITVPSLVALLSHAGQSYFYQEFGYTLIQTKDALLLESSGKTGRTGQHQVPPQATIVQP